MGTDVSRMGRRYFVRAFGAGVLAGGGVVAAVSRTQRLAALASFSSSDAVTVPTTIDPNTIRRRGVGFRGYDANRASPGFTLFAPTTGTGNLYLIDILGNVTHTWKLPYPPGLYGYLTEQGTLFYNGQIPNDSFLGKSPFMGGAVMETDLNGRVLWEIKHPDHHHDGRLLRNGNALLLCSTELPARIAKRIKGGLAGTEQINGTINGDYLIEKRKMAGPCGSGARGSTWIRTNSRSHRRATVDPNGPTRTVSPN